MTVANVAYETVQSRRAQVSADRSSSLDWALRIVGSDILDDIIETANLTFPQVVWEPHAGLWLVPSRTTYTPLGPGHAATVDAHASWDAVCTYVDPARADDTHQLDVGECRIQGSTTGGTAKILTSLETVNSYGLPGETPPDFGRAVNVTRDNEVKGVDKVVPACKFSIQTRLAQGTCTNTSLISLEEMTGTYNNALWWGRPAGEVLFLGGDVTVGSKAAPTIDLHFLRIPNLTGLMINNIGPIEKLGQHFLWVLFEEAPEAASKYMPAKPKAVYVERIYEPSDFGLLPVPVSAPAIATWPPV